MKLVIRGGQLLDGARRDVAIERGTIRAIGPALPAAGPELDASGCTVLPGLHDHHLHLLATAARRQSVDLSGLLDPAAIHARLAAASGSALRAVGYDERAAGLPDAALLDQWEPVRALKLQDRTGALWVLNSAALAALGGAALPPGAERDSAGRATGRFWREDAWLGAKLPRNLPDLPALGRELAALGLTALTDAGANNGPAEARLLARSVPQRLTVMGSEALVAGDGYALGPLKLLIDERAVLDLAALAARIGAARVAGRAVAAHCVTETELALYLAALTDAGGARAGDRIEHGAMIGADAIPVIAAAGLTVVTNPGFLHDRGDRYHREIAPAARVDLYRARSLLSAGITLRAGSDTPYASFDPWLGMRSARDRLSAGGIRFGRSEALDARAALALWQGGRLAVGAAADLLLCAGTPDAVLHELTAERVHTTIIGGAIAYLRD